MSENRQSKSLERALAELRPVRASENFTRRVLAELDERRPSIRARTSPRWAMALAALLVIGLGLGLWLGSRPGIDSEIQENQALQRRQEYESLRQELAALRSLADRRPPVLYLGGDSQIDLVLDLGQAGPKATKLNIRTAADGDRSFVPQDRRP